MLNSNKCENCDNDHNGEYGSGRFCSSKCARGFSTKAKRKEINEKVSKTLTKDPYKKICDYCKIKFRTKRKNMKFCSKSCASINTNINRIVTLETKNKMSKSIKELYKNGKIVKGGTTKWYKYKDIKVQGTYELRVCKILDNWKNNNIIYNWEYTNDRVTYIGLDNKKHQYLIDFKIFTDNKNFYYLEVKGWERPNDKLKWDAVRKLGHELKVWFNDDIIKIEKQ